jgi:ADP-ribose pyrophosphatase
MSTRAPGSMPPEEWTRLESRELADYEIFSVRRVRARSPKDDQVYTFHVLDFPDWVNVVPFTADGRVLMVLQYRHGAGRVTLEFPSGVLAEGEEPGAAARRELEEETSYTPGRLEIIAEIDPNPAVQGNRIHLALARACTPGAQRGQNASEDVRVRVLTPAQVDELIERGEIRHSHALAAWALARRYAPSDVGG